MVKTKQQKSSKPKKIPRVKRQGKPGDDAQFRAQLDTLGLKIIQVTADVCRALADQLEGNEEEHGKHRGMVMQYISKNRDMFEPFIEDDVPFDEYCQSMEKDGTWAGHMELQAASLVTRSNICIHRYMSPRWYIRNFDQRGTRMIHLSYHDGEHYNSVRLKEDTSDGPARPITIEADAKLSATSHQAKAMPAKLKGRALTDAVDSGSIKLVMAGSGCENAKKVEQVLLQVDGDVDAAIEFLIAEQETDDCTAQNSLLACHAELFYERQRDSEDGSCETNKEEPKKSDKYDTHDDSSFLADDKKIPRNKVCPCGSKKKYKACCGAAKGRPSTKFVFNQTVDSRKSRRERKRGKKGEGAESVPSSGSDSGLPDMGALCI